MARKTASNGVEQQDATAAAAAEADPTGVGMLLRQAREASGLSLENISERTKVRPGILADIEAGNYADLPALTYSLGFVKAFARTVGVDPQIAADRYRAESMMGEPVPSMIDLEPLEARRLPSRGLVMVITIAVVLILGLLTAWGAGWLTPEPEAQDLTDMAAPPDTVEEQAAQAQDLPETETETETETASLPAGTPVRLTANTEVWLRITDGPNGETLFMGTLAKGQSLDLPPGRPWQLRTGRAGALDVFAGGRQLPPLGGAAEQVRGLVLTPEALANRAPAASGETGAAIPGLADARSPADSSAVNPGAAMPDPSPIAAQDRP